MDNYINEIANLLKLPYSEISNEFKIMQIGCSVIYVTNFVKILNYSDSLIVLKVKKDLIEIRGVNLKIKMLNKNEILVNGKILSCIMGSK